MAVPHKLTPEVLPKWAERARTVHCNSPSLSRFPAVLTPISPTISIQSALSFSSDGIYCMLLSFGDSSSAFAVLLFEIVRFSSALLRVASPYLPPFPE